MIIQYSRSSEEIQKCFLIRSAEKEDQKSKKKIQQNCTFDQNKALQKHFTFCSNQFQPDVKASEVKTHIQSDSVHAFCSLLPENCMS